MKALVVGIFAAAAVASAQTAPKLAGTYSIRICPATCASSDSTKDIASGYMVLDDKPVDISSLPFLARYRIREKSHDILQGESGNACFSLRKPYHPRSMAGIIPEAVSRWVVRHDTLWVVLYGSPDANYSFQAILGKGPLAGVGRSFFGFGGPEEDKFTDVKRIGPPDILKCFPKGIVAQYMSNPEPIDNEYKISALLDLRDRAEKSGDSILIKQAYSSAALVTDAHGDTFYAHDSIIAAKHEALKELRLQQRTVTRYLGPRFVGKDFAYIEENLEVRRLDAQRRQVKGVTNGLRISIAERIGDVWLITREITVE